jgi:hypothetical protein
LLRLSPFILLGFCNHCNFISFFYSTFLSILCWTLAYASSIHNNLNGPIRHFITNLSFYDELLAPSPTTPAGGPPIVGCTRLLIQYIHSYSWYLVAISTIHSLRMHHAMVRRASLNMGIKWATYL